MNNNIYNFKTRLDSRMYSKIVFIISNIYLVPPSTLNNVILIFEGVSLSGGGFSKTLLNGKGEFYVFTMQIVQRS